jgi:hypothetical protein
MTTGIPVIVSVTDLDPDFYGSDPHPPSDNDRLGPDRDAGMVRDMFVAQAARVPGLQPPVLLGMGPIAGGALPTRENLSSTLQQAAAQLTGPNDTLFFYYSGHGARLKPDVAGPGNRDVLCLLDGFLLDVELVAAWHLFAPGSRVLVISDCCHAGDIATTSLWSRVQGAIRRLLGGASIDGIRSLLDERADSVAAAHSPDLIRQFNTAAAAGGTDLTGLGCSLLNFAASGADELLPTSDGESPFAQALVVDFGLNREKYHGYVDLATDVIADVQAGSSTLHPTLEAAGSPDQAFENSTPPFTL